VAQYVKRLIGTGTDLQEHHPIVPIPVNEQKNLVPPAHSGAGIPGRLFSFFWTNCGFVS
jgi:hypothetical protein